MNPVVVALALAVAFHTVVASADTPTQLLNQQIKQYSNQEIVLLDVGDEYGYLLKSGVVRTIRLVSVDESVDSVVGLTRRAEVRVEIDGVPISLLVGPYVMPTEIDGLRIQADTTSSIVAYSAGILFPKRVQLSLWDATDPIVDTDRFGFPLQDYLIFSHGLQTYNDVLHLGWGDGDPDGAQLHHNYGLDLAGYEGGEIALADVDGQIVEFGTFPWGQVVDIEDAGGLIWEYAHLDSIMPDVQLGARVSLGQAIGVLGNTGGSGNFSHLHVGTYLSRSDLDNVHEDQYEFGNQQLNLFPWFMTAYRALHPEETLFALAGPHQTVSVGENVNFDGSRSLSFGAEIAAHRWVFHDGQTVDDVVASKVFDRPGVYIETLRVVNDAGLEDVDFCKVKVFSMPDPEGIMPSIFMTYAPTRGITTDHPVQFRFWLQGATSQLLHVDFGDGVTVDDYEPYGVLEHSFATPGIHIVTAQATVGVLPITQKLKVRVADSASTVGSVPDGSSVPGAPLTLTKTAQGFVTLAWGNSCQSDDTDYEVYKGRLGDFASQTAVTCSTGSASSWTFSPGPDNSYFLVVPTNGVVEGSYGTASYAIPRRQARTACLPRSVGACD